LTLSDPAAAILTGDLLGSTRAAPADLEAAIDLLAATADEIAAWMPEAPGPSFTRYRGDGWQLHVAVPALALRALLFLIARLRAADIGLGTRAAIGIGEVASLGTESLADARGPAFEASGRALDAIGPTRRLAIEGEGVTPWQHIIVDLLDERSARWTRPQAEAMHLALALRAPELRSDEPTLAEMAATLDITAQAVNYRLTGAGAPAIRRTLRSWEEVFGDA
jgi:hypothetical protein